MKVRKVIEVRGVEIPQPFARLVKVVFAPDQDNVADLTFIVTAIYPGGSTDCRSRDRTELIYVLSGRGVFLCNGQEFLLEPDTAVLVERGDEIQLRNPGPEILRIVSVYPKPIRACDLYETLLKVAQKTVEEG